MGRNSIHLKTFFGHVNRILWTNCPYSYLEIALGQKCPAFEMRTDMTNGLTFLFIFAILMTY